MLTVKAVAMARVMVTVRTTVVPFVELISVRIHRIPVCVRVHDRDLLF